MKKIMKTTIDSKDERLVELCIDMILRCLIHLRSDFRDDISIAYSLEEETEPLKPSDAPTPI